MSGTEFFGTRQADSEGTAGEERGLKQIELATAAGMTESQVSDIERGKNNPGWLLLMRLLVDGLGMTLGDLAAAYERVGEKG